MNYQPQASEAIFFMETVLNASERLAELPLFREVDAALMMQMGADGVFIGSGIFKSGDPAARASACVKATTFFDDAKVVADASRGLGEAMVGINVADIPVPHRLAERGW